MTSFERQIYPWLVWLRGLMGYTVLLNEWSRSGLLIAGSGQMCKVRRDSRGVNASKIIRRTMTQMIILTFTPRGNTDWYKGTQHWQLESVVWTHSTNTFVKISSVIRMFYTHTLQPTIYPHEDKQWYSYNRQQMRLQLQQPFTLIVSASPSPHRHCVVYLIPG